MECPPLKDKRKFKKRAMKVTWNDTDSSSMENKEKEEVVNMCFIAINDDEVHFTDEEFKPFYIELENTLINFTFNFKNLV